MGQVNKELQVSLTVPRHSRAAAKGQIDVKNDYMLLLFRNLHCCSFDKVVLLAGFQRVSVAHPLHRVVGPLGDQQPAHPGGC